MDPRVCVRDHPAMMSALGKICTIFQVKRALNLTWAAGRAWVVAGMAIAAVLGVL